MSEYQYYEFLTIDRPLSAEDRAELRRISTRADITPTRFTNEYEWGDLKADSIDFMKQWFDVHVYLANWGTRELMLRLPKALVDLEQLLPYADQSLAVQLFETEDYIIIVLHVESEFDEVYLEHNGRWMARLSPLREDILAGDYRLLYLLWLYDIQGVPYDEDIFEPMPGAGPMTPRLEDAVEFFGLDEDLVRVATERGASRLLVPTAADLQAAIWTLKEDEMVDLLARVAAGDGRVASELRVLAQRAGSLEDHATQPALRSIREIMARFEPRDQE